MKHGFTKAAVLLMAGLLGLSTGGQIVFAQEMMVEEVNREAADRVEMYRLYNPNSGEHFYTAQSAERNNLTSLGWRYEGIGWVAPSQGDPVYRLYNKNAGDHHYTMSAGEKDHLVSVGWSYEGAGWSSDAGKSIPLYRQYNPNAKAGSHNYTTSKGENDSLKAAGWKEEGIGWYALEAGKPIDPAAQANTFWKNYLDNRQFKNDTKTTSGLEYVLSDLNRDGVSELAIRKPDGYGFGTFWLYTLNGTNAKLIDSRYGYAGYVYNSARNQIVLPPEVRPSYMGGAVYRFASVQTGGLVLGDLIARDGTTWTLNGKVVSEAQAQAALSSNTPLSWTALR